MSLSPAFLCLCGSPLNRHLPLHSFRKTSQDLQEKSKSVCSLTVLMNKAWAWEQFWVVTSVWIWGGCETDWFRLLAFRSLCGFRPTFSFLALSLPFGVFWLVATTWASLLLQLNLIHTQKSRLIMMATKKKHFWIKTNRKQCLEQLEHDDLQISTIVNSTLVAIVLLNARYTAWFFKIGGSLFFTQYTTVWGTILLLLCTHYMTDRQ